MKRDTINVSTASGGAVTEAFDEALKLAERRGIELVTQVTLYARDVDLLDGGKRVVGWDVTVEGVASA